jgi:hypothetical protein
MNDQHTIHKNPAEIKLSISYAQLIQYSVFLVCMIIALCIGYLLGSGSQNRSEQPSREWQPTLISPQKSAQTSDAGSTNQRPQGNTAVQYISDNDTATFQAKQFFAASTGSVVGVTNIKPGSITGFFASKSGKTYYTAGCRAGNRVKTENRIYFASAADAEFEGLKRAAKC